MPSLSSHSQYVSEHLPPDGVLTSRPAHSIEYTEFGKEAEELDEQFKMTTDTTNLKLQFLKESFSVITQKDIDAVKSGSKIWDLIERKIFWKPSIFQQRKEYFDAQREEIKLYAQQHDFKTKDLDKKYTGTYNQNIIFKSYLKHILFSDEEKMNAVNTAIIFKEINAPKNKFDTAVNENYNFDYTQSYADTNTDTISTDENIENTVDERTQKAVQRLSENIAKKGVPLQKNAIMLISDIRHNTMSIIQNGKKIDEISPVVFSKKGVGNTAGSHKTPTGSFIIKERGKRALQRNNNVTGYFLHMAGLENANANAYARAIGIHGMPTDDYTMKNGGAYTHGCTGMTNENIQKLYTILKGKQAFVETIA